MPRTVTTIDDALQVFTARPTYQHESVPVTHAYRKETLKQAGELGRNCRSPYLNDLIERDHRFVKKRVVASQGFRSVEGALNTIAGYEAMNIIRKGRFAGCRRATSPARYNS